MARRRLDFLDTPEGFIRLSGSVFRLTACFLWGLPLFVSWDWADVFSTAFFVDKPVGASRFGPQIPRR